MTPAKMEKKQAMIECLLWVVIMIVLTLIGWIILIIKLGFLASFGIFLLMWGSALRGHVVEKFKEIRNG